MSHGGPPQAGVLRAAPKGLLACQCPEMPVQMGQPPQAPAWFPRARRRFLFWGLAALGAGLHSDQPVCPDIWSTETLFPGGLGWAAAPQGCLSLVPPSPSPQPFLRVSEGGLIPLFTTEVCQ